MRGFGTALLVLLVPLAAVAKWQVFDVPGAGKSAWISDAGDYAVATTTGAYRLDADGGIVERLETGTMIDAFIDGRGCLAAVPNVAQSFVLYADPGCGPTDLTSATAVTTKKPVRLWRAHGGAAYLGTTDATDSFFFAAPDGTPANAFDPLPSGAFLGKPSTALGALRSNGVDVALSGLTNFNPPLALIVDAGTPEPQLFASPQTQPVELALVDPSSALLTIGTGELVRVTGLGGSTPTWNVLAMSDSVHAIGFAPDTDQDHVGLGMAGSTGAGPVAFQFAVPVAGAPGETWSTNNLIPQFQGVAVRADCTVDGRCIAVTDATDAGNVVLYTNAAKPTWAPPAQFVTDAGTVIPINVTPTDLDGDPLAVSWNAAAPLSVQPVKADGTSVNVTVPESATSCDAPYLDYAVEGSLTDGLAAHRDTRTVNVRVQRVFSPLADAVPSFDAGYQSADAQWVGTVDASGLNCPAERGLGAEVALSVDGVPQGTKTLDALPASFAFPRVGCLAQTGTLSATLTQTDGSPGPTVTRTVQAPGQPAGLEDVVGGPLIATCRMGASGNLTAVRPAQACPAQNVTWTQEGGPALTTPSASGEAISVQTTDLGLQALIGQTVSLRLTADSGAGTASLLAQIPIVVVPFIVTRTELESPIARTDAPLGVRVTVVNPTECPIDGASLVEQVDDAELVPGTARIDGRPVEATLEDGRLTIPGLSLAPGEPHQVSFDLRPHVLGAPAPLAQIVLRGVPISENTSLSAPPTAAGCSCRTASGGPEGLGYLVLVGFLLTWRKRHATPRRQMRKSIR